MNVRIPEEWTDKDKINEISRNDEDSLQEIVEEVSSFCSWCGDVGFPSVNCDNH